MPYIRYILLNYTVNVMAFLCACILLMFTYRVRGGGFYKFGNDTTPRTIWALSFSSALVDILHCKLSSPFLHDFEFIFALSVLAFIAVASVPHSFCMGMGTESAQPSRLRDCWPAFYMPFVSQLEWQAMSMSNRRIYDVLQMAGVAFFRALIVYIPYFLFTHDLTRSINAGLVITSLQPVAYWIGWKIPFSIQSPWLQKKLGSRYGSIATARSTEWGEVLNGAAWSASLMALTIGS